MPALVNDGNFNFRVANPSSLGLSPTQSGQMKESLPDEWPIRDLSWGQNLKKTVVYINRTPKITGKFPSISLNHMRIKQKSNVHSHEYSKVRHLTATICQWRLVDQIQRAREQYSLESKEWSTLSYWGQEKCPQTIRLRYHNILFYFLQLKYNDLKLSSLFNILVYGLLFPTEMLAPNKQRPC